MPRLQRYQAPALSCYSPPSFSLSAAQPQAARRLNPGCTNVSSNKLVTSFAASALRVNIKPFVVLILSLLSGFDVGVRMAERCSKDFPKRMGTELQVRASISITLLLHMPIFLLRSCRGFATLFGKKCSESRSRSCERTAAICTKLKTPASACCTSGSSSARCIFLKNIAMFVFLSISNLQNFQ